MARVPGVILLVALASLAANGCSRNQADAVTVAQHYVLEPFPNATIGDMVSAFFDNPTWSAVKRKDGFFEIKAVGLVRIEGKASRAELTFLGSRRLSTVVPFSLEIDGQKMADVLAYQFLKRMYGNLFPDSQVLIGEWVNEDGYQRTVHFMKDGTFRLRSWPWVITGTYQVVETNKTIVFRLSKPLDFGVQELEFAYTFNDSGNLLLVDPEADIFLLSEPLEFTRSPQPQVGQVPRTRLNSEYGTGATGSRSI